MNGECDQSTGSSTTGISRVWPACARARIDCISGSRSSGCSIEARLMNTSTASASAGGANCTCAARRLVSRDAAASSLARLTNATVGGAVEGAALEAATCWRRSSVCGPATPSAGSSFASWKRLTASLVSGPSFPSATPE